MFEFFNNILCVQADWLYGDGGFITFRNYMNLRYRKQINVLRRGGNGRTALVEYDSLPERFRVLIEGKCGNPHKTMRRNRFSDLLELDVEAKAFFDTYTLENGGALPEKAKLEYTANASVLNAVKVFRDNRTERRKALGGGRGPMWDNLAKVIAEQLPRHTWPHSLPKNGRRLRQKLRDYEKGGYGALVSGKYGNANSAKLTEEAKLWLFSRWADRVERVTSMAQLHGEYLEKAEAEGWPALSDEKTIHNYLNQPEVRALWYGHRHGELKAKEKYGYQHSTKMASCRDALWYADGTKLNYYYLAEDGKIRTVQVYEVMDAYSEVFLGYHISDTEDYEAQFYALKMASKVSGHRPYELKFDGQGGHAKLKAGKLLDKVARLAIRTKPYNGKSKTIESAFGRFQKQFLKRDWFFTGQNITAKSLESKANMEHILANKENLPSLSEIKETYRKRREEWNNAPHYATGEPRAEMYRASLNPKAKRLELWDMVDLFWIERPKEVTCTARGISFTEKKTEYTYMVHGKDRMPDVEWLRDNIDRKFTVRFDPENMDLIYLYERDAVGLRFVTAAETKLEVHRAKQDQEEFEARFFADMKKLTDEARIKTRDEADEILEAFGARNEDYGLNEPNVKGVENRRKSKKGKKAKRRKVEKVTVGQVEKAISNATEAGEIDLYNLV
ncbi:hypothetical protein FUAX_33250 [Fulvitalea axinellae]|uniref:Integrase catalytic domain-containing protein n=2 Tax=Fulvitalea axinellae TaxID=1182444 RepID=A0AAU9CS01_9BACT|nr:hypothetical protein FUAX_33250 [Fulvitalea axinellae]